MKQIKTTLNKKLNKTLLATAIGMSLAASVNFAYAEEAKAAAADEEIEVIQVTGIKGSLMQSMNNKRFSNDIVDTISAEDIGKFPDANIAESLQRVTGISIDREGGEGQSITIRGLGPSFNTVLFNGRMVATDTDNRSFSLDTLASETIKSVDVYKSGNATITEGGIGGTVDITTAKPFDKEGFRAAGSVKALHTDSSGKTEPQFSFLASNTFLDDRLGVLGSVNFSERTQVNRKIHGFRNVAPSVVLDENWGWPSSGSDGGESDKRNTRIGTTPQGLYRNVMEEERTRQGANLVVQYQATDNLVITADALYSEFDVIGNGNEVGVWFWHPLEVEYDNGSDGTFEGYDTLDYPTFIKPNGWEVGSVTGGPGVNPLNDAIAAAQADYLNYGSATMLRHGGSAYVASDQLNKRISDTKVFGLNADWQINDDLSMVADVFWSEANRDNINRAFVFSKLDQGEVTWRYDHNSEDYPTLEFPEDLQVPSEENDNDHFARKVNNLGYQSEAENIGLKLDFNWQLDAGPLQEIAFGFSYAENSKDVNKYYDPAEKEHVYHKNAQPCCGASGVPVPDDLISIGKLDGNFAGYSDDIYQLTSDEAYLAWLRDPATLALVDENMANISKANNKRSDGLTAAQAMASLNNFNPFLSDESYSVQEDVTALYIQGLFDFEVAGMPVNIVGGLRYVETDISSSANWFQLEAVTYDAGDPNAVPVVQPSTSTVIADDTTYGKKSSSYDNWLPNIIANLSITDELKLRVSASKTLTRAQLDQISPFEDWKGGPELVNKGQNPDLEPYLSTNYDMSLEWYYDEASMASIAYFKKDVQDWIIQGTTLGNQLDASVDVPEGRDITYTYTAPMNLDTSKLDGIEVNIIHTFDSGFGIQANATVVDSKGSAADGSTFALEGVSDSYNLIGFYENGPFQARLAYNVRDAFLQKALHEETLEPRNVAEYKQLDASASFDINETVTVFFEGINLTDEATEKYGRNQQQFISYQESGPRYALGVRAKF